MIGLLIVAYGTYLMKDISPASSRPEFVFWLAIRNFGTGLAFMPIMTGSISVLPVRLISRASAINNIVLRVSSALGLALLTAMLTTQQAQQLADRSVFLPSVAPGNPGLQGVGASPSGVAGLFNATQLQVFGSALGDVFLLTAALSALGALLALFLPRRRKAPAAGEAAPAAHAEV
jgi:hypothetical protein